MLGHFVLCRSQDHFLFASWEFSLQLFYGIKTVCSIVSWWSCSNCHAFLGATYLCLNTDFLYITVIRSRTHCSQPKRAFLTSTICDTTPSAVRQCRVWSTCRIWRWWWTNHSTCRLSRTPLATKRYSHTNIPPVLLYVTAWCYRTSTGLLHTSSPDTWRLCYESTEYPAMSIISSFQLLLIYDVTTGFPIFLKNMQASAKKKMEETKKKKA